MATISSGFAQTASPVAAPVEPSPIEASARQQPSRPAYDPDQAKPRAALNPSSSLPAAPRPQPAQPPLPPPRPISPEKVYTAYPNYDTSVSTPKTDALGSAYIPMDSWVYPAMMRLYSMGFLDSAFIGMRPWTRRSAVHMLQKSQVDIVRSDNEEAQAIYDRLLHEFSSESPMGNVPRGAVYGLQSVYTRFMGIGGTSLRDSYHIGQTVVNDYGRPYQGGFNNVTGFSTLNEAGRFSLYVRAEYQHSAAAAGYSYDLAATLSKIDRVSPYAPPDRPQDTVPEGPIAAENNFRVVEAALSFHLLGHEISGGKTDAWLGPAQGGAMAWSNNAENQYTFRINRVEPMYVPWISRVTGPLRYDFFYGSLKGHTDPNSPYAHAEMFSLRPTKNFEFGFERTIIFGGKGHTPVTLHTFLNGFFNFDDTTPAEKYSREDPGARFSDFNFSWRLPFVRKYATLYLDSICHDDVTPISAPRRASYRTGLYLSQFPGSLKKMDLRVEAVTTDPGVTPSHGGEFSYWEIVQHQGYTNKGYITGDWIGREAKGGQAWLTYHLSGNEWVQLEYLNKKVPKDFVPFGTTQNQFKASVVKRFGPDVELNAWFEYEGWKAPVYKPGHQSDTIASVQLTWYPPLRRFPN